MREAVAGGLGDWVTNQGLRVVSSMARGCGKLILFGEHFVVHNAPALALVGAVATYTDCDCEFVSGSRVEIVVQEGLTDAYSCLALMFQLNIAIFAAFMKWGIPKIGGYYTGLTRIGGRCEKNLR